MAKRSLTNIIFYRRRIGLAYLLAALVLLTMLAVALIIPGGVTPAEQASSVRSLHITGLSVNAPYYWLQKASIRLIGFSTLAIKLPSIVLGALLGVSLFLLLRRWLSVAIALFSALIIFCDTTFLMLSGTGTPLILYALYPALLLFFGTRVLSHDRGLAVYTLLLLITISGALLTPTMGYLLVLALMIALFNPHVRYGFRRLPFLGLLAVGIGTLAAFVPLGLLIARDPSVVPTLFAVPAHISLGTLRSNLAELATLLFGALHPRIAYGMVVPLIGLAGIGLAVLGLYRTIRGAYTARAQFVLGWSGLAVIVALINAEYGILLFLPVVLLASTGLGQLAAIWYRTFPLNPYARISAIVPIGILIVGIIVGSTLRYVSTTLYASGSQLYSHDLQLLRAYAGTSRTPFALAVTQPDHLFYEGLSVGGKLYGSLPATVIDVSQAASTPGKVISVQALSGRGDPVRIITDSQREHADRFYVYD